MTFLDSSAIIDYLGGVESVIDYLDGREPFFTSTLCVYEVIDGKLGSGATDVRSVRRDFGGVQALDLTEDIALEAARLPDDERRREALDAGRADSRDRALDRSRTRRRRRWFRNRRARILSVRDERARLSGPV